MGLFSLLRSLFALIGAAGIVLVVTVATEKLLPTSFFTEEIRYEIPAQKVVLAAERVEGEKQLEKKADTEFREIPTKTQTKSESVIVPAHSEKSQQPARNVPGGWEVSRIENPYGIPPRSFADINTEARAALVNIFCNASGSLSPITASGVIVDGKGAVLTNAHVAQFILLEQSGKVNLRCALRSGAPARDRWLLRVLYIPPEWVREHAHEITDAHALGTGEHDWALLYITDTADGSVLPASFPHLPPDVRSAIGFTADSVLVASYPAGFLGGLATSMNLYPASAPTTIQELMTFSSGSADIFSIGGTITAQSGSSGGAVVNSWGYMIGLITTMKEGETTNERDLRALSLNYINTDLKAHTGSDLTSFISGNLAQKSAAFMATEGNVLAELLLEQLK